LQVDPTFTKDMDQFDYESEELTNFDGSSVEEERDKNDKFPKFLKEELEINFKFQLRMEFSMLAEFKDAIRSIRFLMEEMLISPKMTKLESEGCVS